MWKRAGFDESFEGFSAGVGARMAFGSKKADSLCLDLSYRATDGGFSERRKELEGDDTVSSLNSPTPIGPYLGFHDLQLSFGWNHRF